MRTIAVYTQKHSNMSTIWQGFKLVCKLAFAVTMFWAYAIVGFSL